MELDAIQKLQKQAISLHQGEDGIWDYLIGLMICMFAIAQIVDAPGLVGFAGFIPLLLKRLKERVVYPRIGIALFTEEKPKASPKTMIILTISAVLVAGMIGFLFVAESASRIPAKNLPIFSIMGIIIGFGLVLGGWFREVRLYFGALGVLVLLALVRMFLFRGSWQILSLILFVILFVILWVIFKRRQHFVAGIASRPARVMHFYFFFSGLLVLVYSILSIMNPEAATWVSGLLWGHIGFVSMGVAALCIMGVGIAYYIYRFFLYAFLLIAADFLPFWVKTAVAQRDILAMIVGGLILLCGFWTMLRFTRRYPILTEGADE